MSDDVEAKERIRKWWWIPVKVVCLTLLGATVVMLVVQDLAQPRHSVFVSLPDGCLLVGAPVSESSTSALITLPAGEQEVEVDCQGRVYKVKLFVREISVNGADWKLGEPRMETYVNSE